MNTSVDKIIRELMSADILETHGELPETIKGVSQDSRRIEQGYLFIARKGKDVDGLEFVPQAKKSGAVLLVTDCTPSASITLPWIRVGQIREAVVDLSKCIYDNPSTKLNLVGITGTNGKTSSTYLLKSIFEQAGIKTGLIGTSGYKTGKRNIESSLTTPDIDQISSLLAEMYENGCEDVVMEVSSHALSQGRTKGLTFKAAAFTNLSQDHLDFHSNMKEYAEAKSRLFEMLPTDGIAVINVDDPWSHYMSDRSKAELIAYANLRSDCDLAYKTEVLSLKGGRFILKWKEREFLVKTNLTGDYQGANIALAAGISLSMGLSPEDVIMGVQNLQSVPGRLEIIDRGQPFSVFVDYAHTPHALKSALGTIRSLNKGNLILVFGCGGDRDRNKRPLMGWEAVNNADTVIVTNDNPRTENPEEIVSHIISKLKAKEIRKVTVELDRRLAIEKAVDSAEPEDVVVVAGKGAETYQLIGKEKLHFDDRVVAGETLERLGWMINQKRLN